MTVICHYCDNEAKLVNGHVLYPHRVDLAHLKFWHCKLCDAYVGCHPDSDKPLGILAKYILRKSKRMAHRAFDPIWKTGKIPRHKAYKWLAKKLGIDRTECHIGMFDIETCKKVVKVCEELQ